MASDVSTERPYRLASDDPAISLVYDLIKGAFAYMDGRIDPPSSVHSLTLEKIQKQCGLGEIWCLGSPLFACAHFTAKPDCIYIGKLAVVAEKRGEGRARQLVDRAAQIAVAKNLPYLELETRVELVENHTAFQRLGFVKTGEGCHTGFRRPTYIIMRKDVTA